MDKQQFKDLYVEGKITSHDIQEVLRKEFGHSDMNDLSFDYFDKQDFKIEYIVYETEDEDAERGVWNDNDPTEYDITVDEFIKIATPYGLFTKFE